MSLVLIPSRTFFRIGDVAELIGVKPYVIRFWEGEFPFLAPEKSTSGQRVYRRSQIESLVLVKHLLHIERYSIEGAKKKLTELRRQGKLKETMNKLVSEGTILDKPDLIPSSIQGKISDLQKLIRDPFEHGIQVPGLKSS